MIHPTRVMTQDIALGSDPDDVHFEERDGHGFIVLGSIAISVSLASQAAVDKLATVTAQAAASTRARRLREVA